MQLKLLLRASRQSKLASPYPWEMRRTAEATLVPARRSRESSVGTLKLAVHSSGPKIRFAGALLILLGIAAHVMVAVILKGRSIQLAALLPVARLIEALQGLQKAAERVSKESEVKLPNLLGGSDKLNSIKNVIGKLSVKSLKGQGLPSVLTNPFLPSDQGVTFQQTLQRISAQELNLATIVHGGLERVLALDPKPSPARIQDALKKLDQLADDASSSDPIQPKVQSILDGMTAQPERLTDSLVATQVRHQLSALPSVHSVNLQLEFLGELGSIIWATISFSLGLAVLILSNHGFGTWIDLEKCFLWGAGIQAAGQGLQALAPSSAASTFSLQVSR